MGISKLNARIQGGAVVVSYVGVALTLGFGRIPAVTIPASADLHFRTDWGTIKRAEGARALQRGGISCNVGCWTKAPGRTT